MSNKQFSNRLNQELDSIGVPFPNDERVEAFLKLINKPKSIKKVARFQAEAFLNGIAIPNGTILDAIAEELEVNPDWLIGKTDLKKRREN
jgi:hypothetical protein